MTMSRTDFTINSYVYAPGDKIPVILQANNTLCKCPIKSFKFKVWRKMTYRLDDQIIETGEYLSGVKIPGCKQKEAVRREYSIPLPMTELPDHSTLIPGSVDSQTFTVEYVLRCFVKHTSPFEIGQGNCIQFPIQIIHKTD